MSENKKPLENVGGQAVIEGVMMRGPHFWAVAVRQSNGEIVISDHPIPLRDSKILKLPILRGVSALIENLVIGFKALNYSASTSLGEEEEKLTGFQMSLSFGVAAAMVFVLFMAFPFFATKFMKSLILNIVSFRLIRDFLLIFAVPFINERVTFTVIEGLIRISIFVGYIFVISRLKDIKRVFQYHGAEHKVVNAFEHKEELNIVNSNKYSTVHLRCGTNFVIIVFMIAMVLFSFLPIDNIVLRAAGKVLLMPVIAGVAYEVIRRASKSKFARVIVAPGLLLQKLTTKEPDDTQVEVAIASLNRVLELENNYEG